MKLLEESFEWQNMTYELLPYHYADPDQWPRALALTDPDPAFQAFLKAGAARVLVPVRNDAAGALLFFQKTGVPYFGSDPPRFDPADAEGRRFNEILDDLMDETTNVDPASEIDIADDDPEAWIVKVPTSLVWLQPTSELT